jgi:hypothetical protein
MKVLFKIIIGFAVVTGLIIYWLLSKVTDAFSPTYQKVELISQDNEKLYIKTENWGVTGDSQLTIITTEDKREFEIDSTKQIIFRGLEPFIYKVSGDTLFLVVRQESKIPIDFESTWAIIQKEVDNPTMIKTRKDYQYNGI